MLLAGALLLLEALALGLLPALLGAAGAAGVEPLGAGVERSGAYLGVQLVAALAAAEVAGLLSGIEGVGVLRALGLRRVRGSLNYVAAFFALRRDKAPPGSS